MSISSNNYYRQAKDPKPYPFEGAGYVTEDALEIPRYRLGARSVSDFAGMGNPGETPLWLAKAETN